MNNRTRTCDPDHFGVRLGEFPYLVERQVQRSWLSGAVLIGSRLNESVLVGIDDGLHAVPQSKLHQDSGHVGLHRCITDHQIGRDLGIRLSAGEHAQYLSLSNSQLAKRRRCICGQRSRMLWANVAIT